MTSKFRKALKNSREFTIQVKGAAKPAVKRFKTHVSLAGSTHIFFNSFISGVEFGYQPQFMLELQHIKNEKQVSDKKLY